MQNLELQLRAVASGRRIAILKHLKARGQDSVSGIARAIHLSFKATSKHLNLLAAARVVQRDPRRLYVLYRLAENHHVLINHLIKLL